jgi:hypothetical protein
MSTADASSFEYFCLQTHIKRVNTQITAYFNHAFFLNSTNYCLATQHLSAVNCAFKPKIFQKILGHRIAKLPDMRCEGQTSRDSRCVHTNGGLQRERYPRTSYTKERVLYVRKLGNGNPQGWESPPSIRYHTRTPYDKAGIVPVQEWFPPLLIPPKG